MKKRIFLNLSALSAVFTILTAVSVTLLYYRFYQENARRETRGECALVAAALEQSSDRAALLAAMKSAGRQQANAVRLTLTDADGTVLYDSDRAGETLENHAGRAELSAAARTGSGEITRRSDTFGVDLYYYALRLSDGALIRLSRRMDHIFSLFIDTIPLVLILTAALLAASLAAASRLTRKILAPIAASSEALDDLLQPRPDGLLFPEPRIDEELAPFIRKLRSMRAQIDGYIRSLREERDAIQSITRSMREGLIVLDKDLNILSINKAAADLLGAPPADYTGQNILRLSRIPRLRETLNGVLETGAAASFTQQSAGGRFIRFLLSPAAGQETGGVMILIIDVTAEMKAEQVRREFAANVSHELKTPLTSINGFAELIENGMIKGSADIQSCAGRIHHESSRLIALISDIIRLSQIENDTQNEDGSEKDPCFLQDVAREAVLAVEQAAKEKGVRLDCSCDRIVLFGSRLMLYELIYNLTDNAVKYNRPGGTASVTVARENDDAVITVSDDGIGIPEDQQDRIFERFYRVDKSRSKQTGGTGLGLSIAKHAAERFGGTITVSSEEGKGTVMRAVLPLR